MVDAIPVDERLVGWGVASENWAFEIESREAKNGSIGIGLERVSRPRTHTGLKSS